MHNYQDANNELPHNGVWNYADWLWGPPWTNEPPRPAVAQGASWEYKLLPYFEQQNLYNNWNYTTPVKVLMDPARAATGLSSFDFVPYSTTYSAGAVSDYAANAMVIGSGLNTLPGTSSTPPNWPAGVNQWNPFHRTIQGIGDGSSNTVLLGIKALAVQAYNKRGPYQFTLSNGATQNTYDDPIANPGPGDMGNCRGWSPMTLFWMAGSAPGNPVNGETAFGLPDPSWAQWFTSYYSVVKDAIDLDAQNRFGGPYAAGSLMAMADGSVRTVRYGVDSVKIVIPMLTPNGGEVYNLDN
jgi:hypothetical protein